MFFRRTHPQCRKTNLAKYSTSSSLLPHRIIIIQSRLLGSLECHLIMGAWSRRLLGVSSEQFIVNDLFRFQNKTNTERQPISFASRWPSEVVSWNIGQWRARCQRYLRIMPHLVLESLVRKVAARLVDTAEPLRKSSESADFKAVQKVVGSFFAIGFFIFEVKPHSTILQNLVRTKRMVFTESSTKLKGATEVFAFTIWRTFASLRSKIHIQQWNRQFILCRRKS